MSRFRVRMGYAVPIPTEELVDIMETAEAYAVGTRQGTPVDEDDPAYHNNSKYWSELVGTSETAVEQATEQAETSEAYAIGERGGTAVTSDDPAYHNNAKYYSGVADDFAEDSEAYALGTRDGTAVPSTDPTYHKNSKYYRDQAFSYMSSSESYKSQAQTYMRNAEAWAKGTKAGTDVPETDETYHNNAKYYAGEASASATSAAGYATSASGYADTASGKATDAATSASAAASSATAAAGSASDASGYATAAAGSSSTASGYADAASASATEASGYADDAADSATEAAGYAQDAHDALADLEADVAQINSELSNIAIEFYNKVTEIDVDISAYKHASKLLYLSNNATEISITTNSSYLYYEVPTEGLTSIKATGYSGVNVKAVVFADDSNNLIYYYPRANVPSPGDTVTVECTIPTGATKMYIVGQTSTVITLKIPPVVITYEADDDLKSLVVGEHLAENTDGYNYKVGKSGLINYVNLHSSRNGLFNFVKIEKNGSVFKHCGDDITPVSLNTVGYVGGNHGYALSYEYTYDTAHGLTNADIGKTYTPDGSSVTYVLLQITSEYKLVVGRLSSNWSRLYPNIAGNTFNFGTGDITASSKVSYQIMPSVKNGSVEVVENSAERFVVCESYDIIDIGTGVDAIIANVGNNDNDSIAELSDSLITIRNLYIFNDSGAVVIYQNFKALKEISLDYYGGVQSITLGSGGYFAVPSTSYYNVQSNNGSTVSFLRETWNDSDVPPMFYFQVDDALQSATKAMILGFIADGRNALLATSAGNIYGSSSKMYPYLIAPNTIVTAGTMFNSISFRVPISFATSDKVVSNYAFDNDNVYIFIMAKEATNASVAIPTIGYGKNVTVVMSDGITCNTKVTIDAVDIVASRIGYLILKLS